MIVCRGWFLALRLGVLGGVLGTLRATWNPGRWPLLRGTRLYSAAEVSGSERTSESNDKQ